MTYKVHDYHTDWVNAKTAAHLDDKLFKKGLGGKLDKLNTIYTQAMAPAINTAKKFTPILKKHNDLVKEIKTIADAYRVIVNNNGKNARALSVLTLIYESGHRGMVDEMQDDLRAKAKNLF